MNFLFASGEFEIGYHPTRGRERRMCFRTFLLSNRKAHDLYPRRIGRQHLENTVENAKTGNSLRRVKSTFLPQIYPQKRKNRPKVRSAENQENGGGGTYSGARPVGLFSSVEIFVWKCPKQRRIGNNTSFAHFLRVI